MNKLSLQQNVNSFPRPRQIGPKLCIQPPQFFDPVDSTWKPRTQKLKSKLVIESKASPRVRVATLRKTTCPPRNAILSIENIRAVLECKCVQRVLDKSETIFCPPLICYSKSHVKNKELKWTKCYVDKYDAFNRLFRVVRWEPNKLGLKSKWVSRLNLILSSEEKIQDFENALMNVQNSLQVEEQTLTAYMALDCLASEHASPPAEILLGHILKKLGVSISKKGDQKKLSKLIEEFKQLHMQVDVVLKLQNFLGKHMLAKLLIPSSCRAADKAASSNITIEFYVAHVSQHQKRKMSKLRCLGFSSAALIELKNKIWCLHSSLIERSCNVITKPSELVKLHTFQSIVLKNIQNFQKYLAESWLKPILDYLKNLYISWDCIAFPGYSNRGIFPLKKKKKHASLKDHSICSLP